MEPNNGQMMSKNWEAWDLSQFGFNGVRDLECYGFWPAPAEAVACRACSVSRLRVWLTALIGLAVFAMVFQLVDGGSLVGCAARVALNGDDFINLHGRGRA